MNKERRKAIAAIIDRLEELDTLRASILEDLQEIEGEERESFDNMPEGLQESERGQRISDAADKLEEATGALDGWDVDEIRTALESAME